MRKRVYYCNCGEEANWRSSPCGHNENELCTDLNHPVWCDKCVPRDCGFCNYFKKLHDKWNPCIEIWKL